jgi:hypothetical protein
MCTQRRGASAGAGAAGGDSGSEPHSFDFAEAAYYYPQNANSAAYAHGRAGSGQFVIDKQAIHISGDICIRDYLALVDVASISKRFAGKKCSLRMLNRQPNLRHSSRGSLASNPYDSPNRGSCSTRTRCKGYTIYCTLQSCGMCTMACFVENGFPTTAGKWQEAMLMLRAPLRGSQQRH